ncbi:unnamed protein product, partial [Laminaria digitata]
LLHHVKRPLIRQTRLLEASQGAQGQRDPWTPCGNALRHSASVQQTLRQTRQTSLRGYPERLRGWGAKGGKPLRRDVCHRADKGASGGGSSRRQTKDRTTTSQQHCYPERNEAVEGSPTRFILQYRLPGSSRTALVKDAWGLRIAKPKRDGKANPSSPP